MRRASLFVQPRINYARERGAYFFSLRHATAQLSEQQSFFKFQEKRFSRWFLFSAACTATASTAFFFADMLELNYSLLAKMKEKKAWIDGLPTESHVAEVFDAIYKTPYPDGEARYFHDIRHVSRVTCYINALYHLYLKNDLTSETLSKEQIKLLEIAAIFHDAGRQADGKDFWDKESGELFYRYCVNELCMDPKVVGVFAEAIVNKDFQPDVSHAAPFENTYWKMRVQSGVISWMAEHHATREKSLIEKLLHDADAIDIQRIPALSFNPNYLDIRHDGLSSAQTDGLLSEARQLIEMQGDVWDEESPFISRHAYAMTLKSLLENKEKLPLLFDGHSDECDLKHETPAFRASELSL